MTARPNRRPRLRSQFIHRPDEEPDLSHASSCHASAMSSHSIARKCGRNRSAPASPTAAIHGEWNGECPAAILLEPAVLYIPSTAMYNAAMYTRVSSLAPRDV